MIGATLAIGMLAGLSACASEDQAPPEHHHHHHGDGGPRPDDGGGPGGPGAELRGGLFISPMGETFRAGPGQPYPSVVWFQTADADHDGRLTRKEFHEDARRVFAGLDLNHDGVIDASEISAYEKANPEIVLGFRPAAGGQSGGQSGPGGGGGHHGGHHGGMGGGMGGGGGGYGRGGGGRSSSSQPADTRPQGAAWFSLLNIPEPVASSDRDLNGRVTLAEFLAASDDRFDLLDTAKNGYLSFDLLPKTPIQQMRRRRDQP
jgi:hypothetical protein